MFESLFGRSVIVRAHHIGPLLAGGEICYPGSTRDLNRFQKKVRRSGRIELTDRPDPLCASCPLNPNNCDKTVKRVCNEAAVSTRDHEAVRALGRRARILDEEEPQIGKRIKRRNLDTIVCSYKIF